MIIVAVEVIVPEGAVDRVRDALASMETETRKEEGCISYAFSVDVSNAKILRVSERWESMEALEAHVKSPHMAAFGAAVAEIQPEGMDLKAYEVAREVALPS